MHIETSDRLVDGHELACKLSLLCNNLSKAAQELLQRDNGNVHLKQTLRITPVSITHLNLTASFSLNNKNLQAGPLKDIKDIIEELEAENPLQNPTDHLELLAGRWNVLFTTIKVTVSLHEAKAKSMHLCQACH